MPELNSKEQIIAKLKQSESVLITVSDNPSVDELSSALALTLAINKSGKRATAVVSGKMPDAMEFLRPEKTFENSVDSLRDFIIALSKDKADHLKYKLVGDYVKIFITPYKSVISEKDLEFSQGDFNVDFVLALGVKDQEHLDSALAAHGRIFHDASVGVITVGEDASSLSDLNWHSPNASSISEVAVDIIESIDKKSLTKSVATAILTGIVAETDRFANAKTTANVMVLASKLINAGADQQLIISKINEANKKEETKPKVKIEETEFKPKEEIAKVQPKEDKPKQSAGSLSINHEDDDKTNDNDDLVEKAINSASQQIEETPQVEINEPIKASEDIQVEKQEELASQPEQTRVEPPVAQEVYAPKIEEPVAPLDNPAFISENPIQGEEFSPAEQRELNLPRNEELNNTQPQNSPNYPQENIPQPEQTRVEPPVAQEVYAPKIEEPVAPREEYYSQNDQSYQNDAYDQPQQFAPTPILDHHAPGVSASQDYNYQNEQEYRHEHVIQPPTIGVNNPQIVEQYINSQQQQPAQDFGGFPPPPPMPDFSDMPMPPELPPVQDMNFNQQISQPQPTPQPQQALGAENSGNRIMTDQVYQDPTQFRIPGM